MSNARAPRAVPDPLLPPALTCRPALCWWWATSYNSPLGGGSCSGLVFIVVIIRHSPTISAGRRPRLILLVVSIALLQNGGPWDPSPRATPNHFRAVVLMLLRLLLLLLLLLLRCGCGCCCCCC